MFLSLEIFGPFGQSSVPGVRRGLIATIVLLAGGPLVADLVPGPLPCLRVLLLALLFASALTVLRRGTPYGQALVYGALVGAVLGAALGARAASWVAFGGCVLGSSLLCSAASGAAYGLEGLSGS